MTLPGLHAVDISNPQMRAASAQSDLDRRIAALEGNIYTSLSVVTSLPAAASVVDGQEIAFVADATNGNVWRFRYRAASASSFKWEFLGGPALLVSVAATDTISSTTYAALPTATSLTAPLAGDYEIGFSAGRVDCALPEGSGQVFVSVNTSATAAADANSAGWRSNSFNPGGRVQRFNGLAASSAVALQAKQANGNGRVFERDLWLRPIRVG